MSSATTQRSLTYWVFFLTLLLFGGPIMSLDVMITPLVHTLLDSIAAVGAVIATMLVWKAHKKTKANVLAFVGVGLGGVTILQLVHVLSGTTLLTPWLQSDLSLFMPWSWNVTQSVLALTLLSAAPFVRRENFGDPATTEQHPIHTPRQIGIFVSVTIPILVFLLVRMDLPPIYYASTSPSRSPEVVPALLFLTTLLVFLRKGNWRTDSYGHWLNMGLVAFLVTETSGMAFSKELFDSSFAASHILKCLGFGFIVFGFMRPQRVIALDQEVEATKPKGLGLNAKVGILCGIIGFICVMPIAMKSAQTLHEIAANNGIENLSSAATTANIAVEEQRIKVDADLEYLASTDIPRALYRAKQNDKTETSNNDGVDPESGKSRQALLSELFRLTQNLLSADSAYLSFSYFDATIEKVIVRKQKGISGMDLANRQALENSELELAKQVLAADGQRSLVRSNIFVLQDGDKEIQNEAVKASVIDTSLIKDAASSEHNLHVEGTALAVHSAETNGLIGVLILHKDMSQVLVATSLPNIETSQYVVNSDGQFILHPDSSKEIAFGKEVTYTLADEFPGLNFAGLRKQSSANGEIYEKADGVEIIVAVNPESNTAEAVGEQLLYINVSRRDEIEFMAAEIGHEMQLIAQVNLVAAILIGWFFARRFARPVQVLSAAASEFGRSGSVTKLPDAGRDEIGMLTQAMSDMMDEVSSQRGKLMLLAAAVESSIDSIVITTITGKIEYVNPHYERYSGIKSEDIIGKNIMDLREFHENRHILAKEPTKKGDSLVWTGELRTRRADGKWHDEAVTISPINDADGNNTNQSLVIEDITERKVMEKSIERKSSELQRSNYDLEQFAYVASHDLKSPLRAIEVLVDWLKEDLEDYSEGDVQENLTLLVKRTNRLNRLLDDLLAYSRAGRKIGDVKKIDTKEFVEDIATLIAPPEGFVIEADDSLPEIITHHAPLETVFRNLISNAIKHSPVPEEGRIFVSAEDRGNMVEFSVQDNGKGIPAEYAEKVFKMFQTLQARDEKEGSGMGLAIVQRIIDWQGGKIWFHDGPEGKGAVFKFTWNKAPKDMPELDEPEDTQMVKALTEEQVAEATQAPAVVRNDAAQAPAASQAEGTADDKQELEATEES